MTCKRQIFRVGKHTPMTGSAIEFTEAMLRSAVAAYDPSLHEAPIVIGHPKGDDPAFGWIKALEFVDGHVVAEEHQVASEFSEAREAGHYKKVSAAWYMPDAPGNPKPGSMYLKHLGYLGAAAPAIKGLRAVHFAASSEGVLEFASWADVASASLWRRMREFFIEKHGSDTADKVVPDWEVKSLEESARDEPESASISNYTESQEPPVLTADQLNAREAELNRREAELNSRATVVTQQESASRRVAHVAFAEGLVTAGKVPPAQVAGIVAFMSSLDNAGVVEFGEGDHKQSLPSIDWLKSFLTSLPKVVEFGELGRPDGNAVDVQDGAQIARAAVEFQESERKAGREVDTVAAVQHVIKANAPK